jgi:hypothetical protein
MELFIVGNLGVHKARRRSHGNIVNTETDPIGIIDNAVQPVCSIIGRGFDESIKERRDIEGHRIKLSVLHKNTVAVVATFIKQVGKGTGLEIADSIKPVGIVIKVVIKNGRIPVGVAGPDDMGKGIPFSIGVSWTHGDIWKAIDNVDRKDIAVQCSDALQTTLDFNRAVVDIIAIRLQLR